MSHSVLSPSGASRWMSCTPSARLEEGFSNTSSEAAEEGTLAHALGELLIAQKMGLISKAKYTKSFKEIESQPYYTPAMYSYADEYATYVIERYHEAKKRSGDALLFIEKKIPLVHLPQDTGTGDAFILSEGQIEFIDLKYGKGVHVAAYGNKQLMIYALSAYYDYRILYNYEQIRMTIYQPRLSNISTYEIPLEELIAWGEEELKPRAALALTGGGDFVSGDHCRFCRAKALCKTHASQQMQPIETFGDKNPALLTKSELAGILGQASSIKQWLSSVEEFALTATLKGEQFEGLKLVEGRSTRKFADPEKVAQILEAAGYDQQMIYERNLLGLTKMGELLGKKTMESLLGDLIIKPPGKPSLVQSSDHRPAWNSAEKDFAAYFD